MCKICGTRDNSYSGINYIIKKAINANVGHPENSERATEIVQIGASSCISLDTLLKTDIDITNARMPRKFGNQQKFGKFKSGVKFPKSRLKAENAYLLIEKKAFPPKKYAKLRKREISSAKKRSRWDSNPNDRSDQTQMAFVINHKLECYLTLTRFIPPSSSANYQRYEKKHSHHRRIGLQKNFGRTLEPYSVFPRLDINEFKIS